MSRRAARARRQTSPKFMVSAWVGCVVSAGILYVAAKAVMAVAGSFKSCDANNTGLTVSNCGKHGLNLGDLIIFGLFVLSAVLFVSLATAAWRMTRRNDV